MAAGLADVFDVDGAHDLLHAGRARRGRRQVAQEVRLERHHARIHQQQGRVFGDQAGAGHDEVSARFEVREEAAADLCVSS